MLSRNLSLHLKSNLVSDGIRTVEADALLTPLKQNAFRKLIVGGILLGLLPGVCLAQRASQHSTPSATAAPTANTVAPNEPTVAPNSPTAAPNEPTLAPGTTTLAPSAPTVAPNEPSLAPNAPPIVPNAPPVAPGDSNQQPPIPSASGPSQGAVSHSLQL